MRKKIHQLLIGTEVYRRESVNNYFIFENVIGRHIFRDPANVLLIFFIFFSSKLLSLEGENDILRR